MIRTKEQKQESVTALATKLKRSPTIYVTDFTGLNVARLTDLRRKLRAAGVEYLVVKNTLALRAFGEAQVTGLEAHLAGPTALVLAGAEICGKRPDMALPTAAAMELRRLGLARDWQSFRSEADYHWRRSARAYHSRTAKHR